MSRRAVTKKDDIVVVLLLLQIDSLCRKSLRIDAADFRSKIISSIIFKFVVRIGKHKN